MITITLQFNTIEEVASFFIKAGYSSAANQAVTVINTPPATEGPLPKLRIRAKTDAPAPVIAPSMPPVELKGASKETAPMPSQESRPEGGPAPTLDSIRAALREVFNGKGASVATSILKQFSATRISDVKPDQYAAFLKACAA